MVDYRKHEILTGLFIVAAILVFALFSFKVGGLDLLKPFRGRTLACWSDFQDVKGLEVSANVLAGGRKVGRVTAIDLADPEALEANRNLVRVHYEIDDLDLPLDRKTARASVVRDGFIGTFFLKLEVADLEKVIPRPIREQKGLDGGIKIESKAETGFEDLVSKATPLIDKAEKLIDKAETMMTILNTEILKDAKNSPDVTSVAEIMSEVNSLVVDGREFIKHMDRLAYDTEYAEGLHQQVLAPLNKLLDNADTSVTKLTNVLVDQTLRKAHKAIDEAEGAMREARGAIKKVDGLIGTNTPKIDDIVNNLQSTMRTVEGKTRTLTDQMDEILDQLSGTLRDNRPDLRTIVRRIRQTMWELEMASRKLRANPAVVIWGDDEQDLSADPVDETGIRKSGRAKPYDQRDEEDQE